MHYLETLKRMEWVLLEIVGTGAYESIKHVTKLEISTFFTQELQSILKNDYFKLDGNISPCYDGEIIIYNRWGKEVYSSDSYNNELTYERLTSDYQDGIYFYHYKNQEIKFEKTGYFNLQR